MPLILVPAIVTLAVTLLRLFGELNKWSPTYFNPAAGGGGSLVGISWLIPVFAIYFAWVLAKRGEGPARPWKSFGIALLAFVLATAVFVLTQMAGASAVVFLGVSAITAWIAIVFALRAWPALGKTLLAYAFAARVPVAIVMVFAIFGHWGTHYDVPPPDPAAAAVVEAMSPLAKWLWIGLLPQMSIWIYMTVVGGLIVGTFTAAVAGAKRAA
ncbi:MAG: hypothetical protein ACHQNV_05160 [Vicinamibacteria bacterium]